MLPEKILQSDLLDILFEDRNKTYGAYTLRRSYNKTITTAISLTLFIATVFAVLQLTHHAKQRDRMLSFIIDDPNLSNLNDVKPVKPVPPTQRPAAPHFKQVAPSVPKIVPEIEQIKMPTMEDNLNHLIGSENIAGKGPVYIVQPAESINDGDNKNAAGVVEAKPVEEVLHTAQVMPEYPGGIDALKKFMLRNLKQPDDLQPGEKIIVMAFFVVNKNGEIEQVKIINKGRADLNKEVQRVINKMPLWKPGMQNGNAVSVYFNLPVTFMSAEEE